jgi:Bifunctional DNA primase/polymerase, N-terminal/Primase C terminal 1 (PriCT-1)
MKLFQQAGQEINKMEAAWRYAALGWPVLPVHTPTGDPTRPCSCRRVNCPRIGNHPCHSNACKDKGKHTCHQSTCESIGKHPRTRNGIHDASTNEAKIRRWWNTWEEANIGLATGKRAGFFVLDIDPHKGGDETLTSLERRHGKLPKTRAADTGGGGLHYLFNYPDFPIKNSAGKLGPGLDIRSDGGSIIAPPSLHASGEQYRWRNSEPIAEAPEWLLRLLREAQRSYANGSRAIGETIPEGQRNNTLMSLAGTMRRRGMGFDEIEAALLVTNSKRCDPPLAEDEVITIVASVCRYQPAEEAAFR